jgi:hypothetical protein
LSPSQHSTTTSHRGCGSRRLWEIYTNWWFSIEFSQGWLRPNAPGFLFFLINNLIFFIKSDFSWINRIFESNPKKFFAWNSKTTFVYFHIFHFHVFWKSLSFVAFMFQLKNRKKEIISFVFPLFQTRKSAKKCQNRWHKSLQFKSKIKNCSVKLFCFFLSYMSPSKNFNYFIINIYISDRDIQQP